MLLSASSGGLSTLMTLFMIVYMYALYALPLATLLLSFLQVYLCHRDLRWGRILPIVSAVFSVGAALFMCFFYAPAVARRFWIVPAFTLSTLAMFNIPTLVYFLIYRYQKRRRARQDLDRMKIDDLE